jgi:SAM-dependent methyltransferase
MSFWNGARQDPPMGVPPEMFDEDYLFFYADVLSDERSDAEAELVARLLSLEQGMRVLDVPCGEGRIAGRLARLGGEVVGLDTSDLFLGLARARYPDVAFEHRDMRELTYEAEFDAVVNWFSSFGYFDPAGNDALLASFARALRPGGRLAMEMLNAQRLSRILEWTGGTAGSVTERDGDLLADRITYDEAQRRSRTERFIVRGGQVRKHEFTLEQVPAPELERRLRAAGFREVELFGRGGTPFEPEGPRLLIVAER